MEGRKTVLSFVIPCYRSELTIESVVNEIRQVVSERPDYDYEIVCVNDCSPDGVYGVLRRLAAEDPKIKIISFAMNMGKHAAVLAGYRFATGDYVVTLDDDMQSPTYELWRLIEPLERDECDVANSRYSQKKQAWWKNLGSSFNNRMAAVLLQRPLEWHFGNFGACKRFVSDRMAEYPNPYPYLEGLTLQITRRILPVDMEERERGDGRKTGYTLGKSIALFANGFTAFSVIPLRVSSYVGFAAAIIGFLYGLVMIIKKLLSPDMPMGYASTIVLMLFLGGLILMSLGMLGEYVGRIYISINKAPQYVIRETINLEQKR